MVPKTPGSRRTPTGRRRGRPPGTTNAVRAARLAAAAAAGASEPPPKRRRYIPGGAGGGGRFIDMNEREAALLAATPGMGPTRARTAGSASASASRPAPVPATFPRRERSTRIRTTANAADDDDMIFSSAAAITAAVAQNEGYKPREERGWEEFHPHLDIDGTFMVFNADDVDGVAKDAPGTPTPQPNGTPINGSSTPLREVHVASTGNTPNPQQNPALSSSLSLGTSTPPKRRVGRPSRDPVSSYYSRPWEQNTIRAPMVLPIHNQTPKERLDLKQPQYRKTDRILLFESKKFGQARYVDKAMMNVGYQESDNFIRPEPRLIKASDSNWEEDLDLTSAIKGGDGVEGQSQGAGLGRVEYDMDEQDDMWLETYNMDRKANDLETITREVFEITITKIEKEWHALEKRIPKPNPKPPQTHRPRSSSAAAVNGEPQVGEEQDSKCAICDDGDCENTNAIVFCDGCDLAVHQECYGVPFIPEGQWLCRKCQLIGRGIPTCIFCPNTDGAFKQTNSSKWAHLLCAMWIPEVSLGNHTFMEPVMDVEKVPKTRWKLSCYICNQRMGACIQCGNKNCYQAFHVTCARRARLFLKMKNSQGALAVLDGTMVLKAFCDKHCPPDYTKENAVAEATKAAKKFYKRVMKGRIWADTQAAATALAATHRHAMTEHPPNESEMTGAKLTAMLGADKKKGQPGKAVWKLPSGAPVIPQAVFDVVESSLSRFNFRKRKEYVSEACRYWTLKREARRGAALLKRLQLQMETFSSMELTRRNFASMGPSGKTRLQRRIEFAETLIKDLEQLKHLSADIVARELTKLEAAELEQEFVDTCYFPVAQYLTPVIEKASALDKKVFEDGLDKMQAKVQERFYTTGLHFAQDLCDVINAGINNDARPRLDKHRTLDTLDDSSVKHSYAEPRDRKKLGKRILKSVQPLVEAALRAEANVTGKPFESLQKELVRMMEASAELQQASITVSQPDAGGVGADDDVLMEDVAIGEITVMSGGPDGASGDDAAVDEGDKMDTDEDEPKEDGNIEVNTSGLEPSNVATSTNSKGDEEGNEDGAAVKGDVPTTDGVADLETPPATNGYVAMARPSQPAPPTPPQSNGSLSTGRESTDQVAEGGVPWYLTMFDPQGTTVVEPEWPGRSAVRGLSEELSEIDDDELTGLGIDVEADTIMASPNRGVANGDAGGSGSSAVMATADTIVSASGNTRSSAKVKAAAKKKATRSSGRKR